MMLINLVLFFNLLGCNFNSKIAVSEDKKVNDLEVKYKKSQSVTDTLRVSQNDTTVFRKEEAILHRPCSNPEMVVKYKLIQPKLNAYYFIYNLQQQLVLEGKYTEEYTYEGATEKLGNFYNSKNYTYKTNGKLQSVVYMVDGRHSKTELFDTKEKPKEIIYFDKKSAEKTKIELYKKGKLKETRIFTSFNNYYTVKAT